MKKVATTLTVLIAVATLSVSAFGYNKGLKIDDKQIKSAVDYGDKTVKASNQFIKGNAIWQKAAKIDYSKTEYTFANKFIDNGSTFAGKILLATNVEPSYSWTVNKSALETTQTNYDWYVKDLSAEKAAKLLKADSYVEKGVSVKIADIDKQ